MSTFDLGIPQFTDEDAAYQGSRFARSSTRCSRTRTSACGAAGEPPLPVYEVTFATVASQQFPRPPQRTVDSGADLRWGPDRKGFRRIVHPNGVCLIGRWQITADTAVLGLLRQRQHGAGDRPLLDLLHRDARGQTRSLSMVGKLFPTTDPTTRRRCARRTS